MPKKKRRVVSQHRKIKPPPSQYYLDTLSVDSIRRGHSKGQEISEYFWLLYSCLAHQRSLIADEIRQWVQKVSSGSLSFTSYQRIVKYRFTNDPLSMQGSFLTIGGRFNIGSIDVSKFPRFPALYVAEDQKTALLETFGQSADPKSPISPEDLALANKEPYSCVAVGGSIEEHVDLRQPNVLDGFVELTSSFKLSADVLKLARSLKIRNDVIRDRDLLWSSLFDQNWRLFPRQFDVPSNSQILGQIFYQAGIQGILYNSVKGGSMCLALFPQNFANSTAYVELIGQLPDTVSLRRYDANTKLDFLC